MDSKLNQCSNMIELDYIRRVKLIDSILKILFILNMNALKKKGVLDSLIFKKDCPKSFGRAFLI